MKWWGSYTENEHVNVNGEVFGGWVLRTKSQLGAGNFVVHFLQNISKLKTIIYIYIYAPDNSIAVLQLFKPSIF